MLKCLKFHTIATSPVLGFAEGGDVDALAAQLAAEGFDLDADWRELDRSSSTTGRCVQRGGMQDFFHVRELLNGSIKLSIARRCIFSNLSFRVCLIMCATNITRTLRSQSKAS